MLKWTSKSSITNKDVATLGAGEEKENKTHQRNPNYSLANEMNVSKEPCDEVSFMANYASDGTFLDELNQLLSAQSKLGPLSQDQELVGTKHESKGTPVHWDNRDSKIKTKNAGISLSLPSSPEETKKKHKFDKSRPKGGIFKRFKKIFTKQSSTNVSSKSLPSSPKKATVMVESGTEKRLQSNLQTRDRSQTRLERRLESKRSQRKWNSLVQPKMATVADYGLPPPVLSQFETPNSSEGINTYNKRIAKSSDLSKPVLYPPREFVDTSPLSRSEDKRRIYPDVWSSSTTRQNSLGCNQAGEDNRKMSNDTIKASKLSVKPLVLDTFRIDQMKRFSDSFVEVCKSHEMLPTQRSMYHVACNASCNVSDSSGADMHSDTYISWMGAESGEVFDDMLIGNGDILNLSQTKRKLPFVDPLTLQETKIALKPCPSRNASPHSEQETTNTMASHSQQSTFDGFRHNRATPAHTKNNNNGRHRSAKADVDVFWENTPEVDVRLHPSLLYFDDQLLQIDDRLKKHLQVPRSSHSVDSSEDVSGQVQRYSKPQVDARLTSPLLRFDDHLQAPCSSPSGNCSGSVSGQVSRCTKHLTVREIVQSLEDRLTRENVLQSMSVSPQKVNEKSPFSTQHSIMSRDDTASQEMIRTNHSNCEGYPETNQGNYERHVSENQPRNERHVLINQMSCRKHQHISQSNDERYLATNQQQVAKYPSTHSSDCERDPVIHHSNSCEDTLLNPSNNKDPWTKQSRYEGGLLIHQSSYESDSVIYQSQFEYPLVKPTNYIESPVMNQSRYERDPLIYQSNYEKDSLTYPSRYADSVINPPNHERSLDTNQLSYERDLRTGESNYCTGPSINQEEDLLFNQTNNKVEPVKEVPKCNADLAHDLNSSDSLDQRKTFTKSTNEMITVRKEFQEVDSKEYQSPLIHEEGIDTSLSNNVDQRWADITSNETPKLDHHSSDTDENEASRQNCDLVDDKQSPSTFSKIAQKAKSYDDSCDSFTSNLSVILKKNRDKLLTGSAVSDPASSPRSSLSVTDNLAYEVYDVIISESPLSVTGIPELPKDQDSEEFITGDDNTFLLDSAQSGSKCLINAISSSGESIDRKDDGEHGTKRTESNVENYTKSRGYHSCESDYNAGVSPIVEARVVSQKGDNDYVASIPESKMEDLNDATSQCNYDVHIDSTNSLNKNVVLLDHEGYETKGREDKGSADEDMPDETTWVKPFPQIESKINATDDVTAFADVEISNVNDAADISIEVTCRPTNFICSPDVCTGNITDICQPLLVPSVSETNVMTSLEMHSNLDMYRLENGRCESRGDISTSNTKIERRIAFTMPDIAPYSDESDLGKELASSERPRQKRVSFNLDPILSSSTSEFSMESNCVCKGDTVQLTNSERSQQKRVSFSLDTDLRSASESSIVSNDIALAENVQPMDAATHETRHTSFNLTNVLPSGSETSKESNDIAIVDNSLSGPYEARTASDLTGFDEGSVSVENICGDKIFFSSPDDVSWVQELGNDGEFFDQADCPRSFNHPPTTQNDWVPPKELVNSEVVHSATKVTSISKSAFTVPSSSIGVDHQINLIENLGNDSECTAKPNILDTASVQSKPVEVDTYRERHSDNAEVDNDVVCSRSKVGGNGTTDFMDESKSNALLFNYQSVKHRMTKSIDNMVDSVGNVTISRDESNLEGFGSKRLNREKNKTSLKVKERDVTCSSDPFCVLSPGKEGEKMYVERFGKSALESPSSAIGTENYPESSSSFISADSCHNDGQSTPGVDHHDKIYTNIFPHTETSVEKFDTTPVDTLRSKSKASGKHIQSHKKDKVKGRSSCNVKEFFTRTVGVEATTDEDTSLARSDLDNGSCGDGKISEEEIHNTLKECLTKARSVSNCKHSWADMPKESPIYANATEKRNILAYDRKSRNVITKMQRTKRARNRRDYPDPEETSDCQRNVRRTRSVSNTSRSTHRVSSKKLPEVNDEDFTRKRNPSQEKSDCETMIQNVSSNPEISDDLQEEEPESQDSFLREAVNYKPSQWLLIATFLLIQVLLHCIFV